MTSAGRDRSFRPAATSPLRARHTRQEQRQYYGTEASSSGRVARETHHLNMGAQKKTVLRGEGVRSCGFWHNVSPVWCSSLGACTTAQRNERWSAFARTQTSGSFRRPRLGVGAAGGLRDAPAGLFQSCVSFEETPDDAAAGAAMVAGSTRGEKSVEVGGRRTRDGGRGW